MAPSFLTLSSLLRRLSTRKSIKVRCEWLPIMVVCLGLASAQGKVTTTTTLAVTSGGTAVTSISSGSAVTLTASVNASGAPITRGQVNFCDASAQFCTDIHLLGMAQLTSAGTATLKLRPGIGGHTYKAVFLGTNTYAGSTSLVAALGVRGKYQTMTTIGQTGNPGNYSLTATVAGIANLPSAPYPATQCRL